MNTTPNDSLGYICFYNGKQIEIYASSLYDAKVKAIQSFKVKAGKSHMVHCHLAEKNGQPVIHTPDF